MKIMLAFLVLFNVACLYGCNTVYGNLEEISIMESYNSNLTVEDFKNICIGSSFEEVVNTIGAPQYHTGFGIIWDVYKLDDGSIIMLQFYDDIVVDIKNVPSTEVDSYLIYRSES